MRATRTSAVPARRVPDPPLPAALRTVRLVLDLEADLYELLGWGARKMGNADVREYVLDLLTEERAAMEAPARRHGWLRRGRRR